MRRRIWAAAVTLFIAVPISFAAQQAAQSGQTQAQGQAQGQTQSQAKAQESPAQPSGQSSSVAAAARKAQQDQKNSQKSPVVFTNENLPRSSTISVVGASGPANPGANAQAVAAADEKSDERVWRQKFGDARYRLLQDRQKLATLQLEYNSLGMVRYFDDADAVSKRQAIAEQQKQIDADQKALDDLQDALRKAGGDPSWAR
ncbi:MAG TPA: hypothetical protein VKB26_05990 [Candidatus Acidoferrales bacterium]|nr:hypothetical protein [Candidatus Acidoferrales bacterium]